MRVIGGAFRSRRLQPVPGYEVRPTPDRLRETLFDILTPKIEGALFVDAYAGTGAVGIEALSRGALRAVFLEKNRKAVEVIRENVASLALQDRAKVALGSVHLLLAGNPGDIVFLDPPYEREKEYELTLGVLAENPPALAVVQHSKRLALADAYGPLRRTRVLRQGDNVLSFYAVPPTAAPAAANTPAPPHVPASPGRL
jgi:16S rRNA (guanine966-N2)-methyltransferase